MMSAAKEKMLATTHELAEGEYTTQEKAQGRFTGAIRAVAAGLKMMRLRRQTASSFYASVFQNRMRTVLSDAFMETGRCNEKGEMQVVDFERLVEQLDALKADMIKMEMETPCLRTDLRQDFAQTKKLIDNMKQAGMEVKTASVTLTAWLE